MISIIKNETPCFKCNKRTAECHSTCYNYKEWVEEFEKSKEKIKDAKRRRIARNGDM